MQEISETFNVQRGWRCNFWYNITIAWIYCFRCVIIGLNLFLKQADLVDFIEQYVKVSRDCGELCTVLQWNKQQCTHNTVGNSVVCYIFTVQYFGAKIIAT